MTSVSELHTFLTNAAKSMYIDPRENAHRVLPNLFVGNVQATRDSTFMMGNRITHVINLTPENQLTARSYPPGTVVLFVRIDDHPRAELEKYLEQCYQFVLQGMQSGNVLIHCHAGISRSTSVTTYCVMRYCGLPLLDSLRYVKMKRPQTQPNPGFLEALCRSEAGLVARGALPRRIAVGRP